MKPDIERAIARIVDILNEAANCGGMSKEETEGLAQAFRDLVAATLRVRQ